MEPAQPPTPGSPGAPTDAPSPVPAAAFDPVPELPPPDPMLEFQRALRAATPRVYVTWILLGLNVALFAVMAFAGVSVIAPKTDQLIRWGANFGGATPLGEWWRLLTCTFIHIGVLHLALNMWVLFDAGPLVERLVGNAGFAAAYLLSGLIGALASLGVNPLVVSAGASGSIFGIFGVLLGVVLLRRGAIPLPVFARLRNSGLGFIGYNLVYGMMQPNVDMAAHVGGLIGGFACGLLLASTVRLDAPPRRAPRVALLALLGAAAVAGGILLVPRPLAEAQRALDRAGALEKQANEVFNAALGRAKAGQLDDPGLAAVIEGQVLPTWYELRKLLGQADRVRELRPRALLLSRYAEAGEAVYTTLVKLLRQPSVALKLELDRRVAAKDAAMRELSGRLAPSP